MKKQREIEFEKNYSILTFASAVTFTLSFIVFIFILNLTYLPTTIKNNGFSGILILFAYYFLTSIVLAPVLMIINGLLAMLVKKPMKVAYILNPSLGFIVLTATMTIIPYLMSNAVLQVVGKINSFDYYFIYFATWISAILQYFWILNNIKQTHVEQLTEKQIAFLKTTDKVDYF